MFDRTANLANTQIINYRCDPSEKWLVLIGIAPGSPEVDCFFVYSSALYLFAYLWLLHLLHLSVWNSLEKRCSWIYVALAHISSLCWVMLCTNNFAIWISFSNFIELRVIITCVYYFMKSIVPHNFSLTPEMFDYKSLSLKTCLQISSCMNLMFFLFFLCYNGRYIVIS